MAKRTDPCAPQRKRLDGIDAQIQDILDEINDPDLPPAVKRGLPAKLKRLQQQRQGALGALAACETRRARRAIKSGK